MYAWPKVLIGQAGVGLSATLDTSRPESRSPFSLAAEASPDSDGISRGIVLGILLSRCIHYLVCKCFGEVDAARPTRRSRTSASPGSRSRIDFTDAAQRGLHQEIVDAVTLLLGGGESLGGAADLRIEQSVRILYGVKPLGMAFINGELGKLPESQAISELFPAGTARPPVLATPSPADLVERFVPVATPLVELAADEDLTETGPNVEGDGRSRGTRRSDFRGFLSFGRTEGAGPDMGQRPKQGGSRRVPLATERSPHDLLGRI